MGPRFDVEDDDTYIDPLTRYPGPDDVGGLWDDEDDWAGLDSMDDIEELRGKP